MLRDKKYYQQKLTTLRNVIDEMVLELGDSEGEQAPAVRRKLKQERVVKHETNYSLGRWRKPEKLKAKKKGK